MNTDTPYKIVKLTNGDDLICEVDDHDDIEYKINFPLKMEVSSMTTKEGQVDSLNLSRWIGPYTEQSLFSIKTSMPLFTNDLQVSGLIATLNSFSLVSLKVAKIIILYFKEK